MAHELKKTCHFAKDSLGSGTQIVNLIKGSAGMAIAEAADKKELCLV